MDIRRLSEYDAGAMCELRREALEAHPGSFGESVEEFLAVPVETHAARLRSGGDTMFVMGAFDHEKLVGMAGFFRQTRVKRLHKGTVWGVYVAPAYRGRGVGRTMLAALIEAVRVLPGLACVSLSVTSGQSAARRLYASLGFRSYGVEPKALAVDGRYLDEEWMVLEL
jgi:RimJ/RimL family protein N-acetyltransferase